MTIIIGRGGRNIAPEAAMDHVFGYTSINDVTARDVQMRHAQWYLDKSFDTFCPMGPWIVSADELDGANTRVRCWVTPAGGAPELRQDALTTDLIFDLPTLDRHLLARHHALPRRHHRHRHPGRCRHGHEPAALAGSGRRGDDRDRRHWALDEPLC